MIELAKIMHILSATIWVGGMFFAYVALRPAAAILEPEQRFPLWGQALAKFFIWVWVAIIMLPVSGFWMVFNIYTDISTMGMHIHIMTLTGILMILIFLAVFFIPYIQLRLAILGEDYQKAAKSLNWIRIGVLINLLLGLATIALGSAGPYIF